MKQKVEFIYSSEDSDVDNTVKMPAKIPQGQKQEWYSQFALWEIEKQELPQVKVLSRQV